MLALKYYNSILVGIFPSSTFVRCSLLIICTIFCSVNMGVMNFKKFIQNYKFKRTTLRKYVSLAYAKHFLLCTLFKIFIPLCLDIFHTCYSCITKHFSRPYCRTFFVFPHRQRMYSYTVRQFSLCYIQ